MTRSTEAQLSVFQKDSACLEKNGSNVSLVWQCWVLDFWRHVVLCSPRRVSIYLLPAYKQRGEDICCSSSTTLHYSFHRILLSISSFGENTVQLRIDSWFYQVERRIGGWVGGLFSILFVPFWNSPLHPLVGLEAAIEHISVGMLALLSRK